MEQVQWQTEIEVNLDEVSRVVRSEAFARFLLDETEDFAAAAYILQAVLDRLEADGQQLTFE